MWRREIGIDVVAQDRVGHADRAQMLLGRPVVPRQGEGCRGRGTEEGHVDEPLHPGVDSRVDEGDVLPDAVGSLEAETMKTVWAPVSAVRTAALSP